MYKQLLLITTIIFALITLFTAGIFAQGNEKSDVDLPLTQGINTKIDVVYFYQTTCAVCKKVKPTIDAVASEYDLNLLEYEVTESNENRSRFGAFANKYGIETNNNQVPVLYVGGKYFLGEKPIEDDLEPYIKGCSQETCKLLIDPNSEETKSFDFIGDISCTDGTQCTIEETKSLSIWILITAALVDSINPCAIAVLVLLVTYLLNTKISKKRMLYLGFTYIFIVFLAYLLAGLGILKFLSNFEITLTVKYFISGIIFLIAAINLKDAFFKDKKTTLAIPDSAKPYIKKYISKATIPGIIVAGFIVAAVELPCTGAVYLGILSLLSNNSTEGFLYLVIYNLIFVLPLIIILLLAVYGKDISKIDKLRKEKRSLSKIIMSLVMIGLGILLLVL